MSRTLKLSKDAHSRVAVLFVVPSDEDEDNEKQPLMLMAVTVKWLCKHGVPIAPHTGEPMVYHGTFIIQ